MVRLGNLVVFGVVFGYNDVVVEIRFRHALVRITVFFIRGPKCCVIDSYDVMEEESNEAILVGVGGFVSWFTEQSFSGGYQNGFCRHEKTFL